MDFVEGFLKSRGIDMIMVVVEFLSKYAHFIGLKHPFSVKDIAANFTREVVRLHRVPLSVISDWGSTFTSAFWEALHSLQGTKLKRSSAYHPETDGQTEVVNGSLKTYLRCFTGYQPRRWTVGTSNNAAI